MYLFRHYNYFLTNSQHNDQCVIYTLKKKVSGIKYKRSGGAIMSYNKDLFWGGMVVFRILGDMFFKIKSVYSWSRGWKENRLCGFVKWPKLVTLFFS